MEINDNFSHKEGEKNHASAKALGNAKARSKTDKTSSDAIAKGTKGVDLDTNFNKMFENKRNNSVKSKNGKHMSYVSDDWADQGRTSSKSKAQGLGKAQGIARSDYDGGVNKIKGKKGSKSMTNFKNQNSKIRSRKAIKKNGKNQTAVIDQKASQKNSQGGTKSQAKGDSFIDAFSNRDKGSGAKAKGIDTKNVGSWKGSSKEAGNSKFDNFSW